jgi:lipoprotein-anchoring transpeptidase ErfK/SrfK
MTVLSRRTLLSGAAAFLTGAAPAAAQWAMPRADDDRFYDTRPAYGTRRARGGLAPGDASAPDGSLSPYDSDPTGAGPYDSTPAGDPLANGPSSQRPARPGTPTNRPAPASGASIRSVDYARAYAERPDEPFPVPAIRWTSFNPAFLRQPVAYNGPEAPGTIIIDPRAHFLTLVEPGGRAMRYGVGVGKQGFAWRGDATINSKQEWPDWYPPKEMIARQPGLAHQVSQLQSGLGVAGGPHNPLGARAMYLWQGNKDTLYRIHGTTEPFSIGKSVSSGCIRMINQDAIDLYARVSVGARVVVLG